jgi:hypothetical protein
MASPIPPQKSEAEPRSTFMHGSLITNILTVWDVMVPSSLSFNRVIRLAVIGCRARQSEASETCALLRRLSSICRCRRAAGHQVRESCLYWRRRSHPSIVATSHASGVFQDHLKSRKERKLRRECWLRQCCRKTWFHLRNGAKQRLAAGAHRAIVKGPSDFCIMPTSTTQAMHGIARGRQIVTAQRGGQSAYPRDL